MPLPPKPSTPESSSSHNTPTQPVTPTPPPAVNIQPTVDIPKPPVMPEKKETIELSVPDIATTTSVSTPHATVQSSNPNEETEVVEEMVEKFPNFKEEDFNEAQKLYELIIDSNSTEILMNSPKDILYKQGGQRIESSIKFSSTEAYHDFINNFILENTDAVERLDKNSENFLIEGQLTLPDTDEEGNIIGEPLLARVHILAPPVSPEAKVTIAKKSRNIIKLSQMVANNTMSPQMADFLKAIAKGRVTTIFSGLSGSGKTTLLETLSQEFDLNDRIIVVEDTPELRLSVNDVVYLHSTPVKPGSDPNKAITLEWLVSSTNRMRPDRIIVGECRGGEMAEFLIAANSGADGSMTTMHASTPKLTLDKIISLSMKNSTSKSELSIARDVASTLQIIVQTALIEGRHIITHIEEVTRVIRKETGAIATQTLFEYDRNRDVFVPKGRPTDELKLFLAQRGVALEDSWFRGI